MQDDKAPRNTRAGAVRRGDIEAYTALRWVGILFKAAAVFLGVALLAEIIAGLNVDGWAALPTLLGEAARALVFAVVLWGGGDLVRLLIHLGHDVRAERVLLSRIAHRMNGAEDLPAASLLRSSEPRQPDIGEATSEATERVEAPESAETPEPVEEEEQTRRPDEGREAA
jgi:hypothetical protein